MAGGVAAILFVAALAFVLVNREDPDAKPYLAFRGGGFVFNYRIAEVFYGFNVQIVRPVPVGTIIDAEFEDPAGGAPIKVQERIGTLSTRYSLRTPPVKGVVAGKSYRVVVRLRDRDTDNVFATYERSYASNVGDEVMPAAPLTVGPGYHRPMPSGDGSRDG
ncbi:MAG: hypothetical protein KDJ16_11815 [Hyphomicrobiales bacterium]|nr:hypothetical protein [Hyphomicrobiales bacterium]